MDHSSEITERMTRIWHKTEGFTLVEVVVTLTLIGFIVLIVSGTFRLGLIAWEKGDSAKEEYQKVRIISQLMSEQIKSNIPFKIKTKKAEGDYLAFEGKTNSLRFVSSLSLKTRQPEGFVYVVYQLKEGKGGAGGQLVLYEQRALNRDFFEDELKEESEISLLEGITDIRFEYYQEEDSSKNRKEGWVEEWNAKETKEFPRALRMTILQKNGKGTEGESSITLMASLPTYQFEDVKAGRVGVPVRRTTKPRIQP